MLTWLRDCLVVIYLVSCDSVFSVSVEVCIGYEFHASCQPDEIIVMQSAEFGRMGPGKCISADRGNFGCKNDVLFLADMWCSGRKDCQFSVPNADIMEANTECIDVMAFLRASYNCVRVTTLGQKSCSPSSPNIISLAEGVISSHLIKQTRCGSLISPWIIQAKPGQTVEISLLDFKGLHRARSHSLMTCSDVYGFIVEKTLNINQTICGLNTREDVIYRSKTNTVEIQLKENDNMNFLIKYKANGCSDPVPPLHAWYKRNGDEAVIGCENSDKEWRLTCSGNTWQGAPGNCSQTVTALKEQGTPVSSQFEMSTIVVVAGIIGGTIVLAVAVIVCGVVYIQKYKGKLERKFNEKQQDIREDTLPTLMAHKQCGQVSTSSTENQEEYLQPNTITRDHKRSCNPQEPLIHIWETPLPNPTTEETNLHPNQCTIHRNNSTSQAVVQTTSESPNIRQKKGIHPVNTSYYSPNTGHKYYVLDK